MRDDTKDKITQAIVNTLVALVCWSFIFYELLESLCR